MRSILARLMGGGNEAHLSKLRQIVAQINELEAHYQALTDDQIREEMAAVRAEVAERAAPTPPSEEERTHPERERRADMRRAREKQDLKRLQDVLDEVLPDVFAAVREISSRKLAMRPYDVQLMGAIVLHQGRISEQKTGEGKTLVGPIAAALNAMSGRGVHVVTVNDYLAKRDPQWMGPIFHGLGLSLGIIQHDSAFLFDPEYRPSDERMLYLRPVPRKEAYAADVTYATNNELGFDYLRDNMVTELAERVQRGRYFAIVDEVDNILIDEARTPLIISGQAEESGDLYYRFARLVPRLKARPEGAEEGGDYFVDLKEHAVSPTEQGIEKIEQLLGVGDLFDATADPRLARHFEQALRAHALYKVNRDYIVKDGEIVIVDEFTGRQMPGRRWSEGLHQAIEAKEGLRVQRESVTLATITFQNYFRLYDKLAGMTGTAMTEQEEFFKIYGLEVVAIPTHRPMVREDDADLVFRTENAKFEALIEEVAEMQAAGRPILVGTVSVEKSELLSDMLTRRGVKHEVLNAKFHEKEAPIVAQAGRLGAVTIATNMAGRGTDIKLGGDAAGLASEALHRQGLNPTEVEPAVYEATLAQARAQVDAEHEQVVAAGGLHIIGTERHDARRIDNQLRGRSGRQGDPGSSRFYLSLEDTLMKRFASDRVTALMERLGLEGDVAIESRLVSKTIENAQSRVEGYNFDIRKRVVEYDDVINKQRETIYAERDKVLHNEDLGESVMGFMEGELDMLAEQYLGPVMDDWDVEAFAKAVASLGITGEGIDTESLDELESRDEIVDRVTAAAEANLAERQTRYGEQTWAMVERLVLLRSIDQLWVDHLTELDDFRRGVGLRGYGGTDPLVEFKREAYKLYEELRGFIRHQVSSTILRVNVQVQAPAPATPPPARTLPMPTPQQMAVLRAAAAQRALAAQRAAALAAAANGSQPAADGADGADGVGPAEPVDDEGLELTAEDLASVDEIADDDVLPDGAAEDFEAAEAVTAEAQAAVLAGLGGGRPRQMTLQHGDDAVESTGAARPAAVDTGAKIGRNDPCYCGSGLKFKKCHGK
ncbi:MAG: preprotein translocase subunit SecA [Chloroflexi bacterium]|nr:preprotein translocase subunit SecA [Chloroflexota bacterium]